MKFLIPAKRTAPHNSDLTGAILRSGVSQFFDMISLLLNDPLSNSQRRYAPDPDASIDPSLNTTSDGFQIALFGFRHL